jgi:hypothetical protein
MLRLLVNKTNNSLQDSWLLEDIPTRAKGDIFLPAALWFMLQLLVNKTNNSLQDSWLLLRTYQQKRREFSGGLAMDWRNTHSGGKLISEGNHSD